MHRARDLVSKIYFNNTALYKHLGNVAQIANNRAIYPGAVGSKTPSPWLLGCPQGTFDARGNPSVLFPMS